MTQDITAKGSLTETHVIVTLTMGEATLTLTYPRDNEQASDDMADLVASSEDAFVRVLEALVEEANKPV